VSQTVGQVTDVNPIVNDPFEEPSRHWYFSGDAPKLREGRRSAGYLPPAPKHDGQVRITDEAIELQLINELRGRVGQWRSESYPGATRVTRDLFDFWFDAERQQSTTRPFFAQQEAIETIAFLIEAPADRRVGIKVPAPESFLRLGTRMATGTGKTLVMALIISWCGLNKAANHQDRRFSDAFLVICPNLTVLTRLTGREGLVPSEPESAFEVYDLIPRNMSKLIGQVKVINWHKLAPFEDPERGIVQRGSESDGAFARRVLDGPLVRKERIVVLNDEAHHAWRLPRDLLAQAKGDEKAKAEEATVWVDGLAKIHRANGILRCHDMSATPMYPSLAGPKAWAPFEWVISDFALVDAIESGLVKIPRVPTDDNTGRSSPKYRNLWEHISGSLPKRGQEDAGEHPLLDYLAEADGPLKQLAGEWAETYDTWRDADRSIPPSMIIICHNTTMARLLERHIAELGEASPLRLASLSVATALRTSHRAWPPQSRLLRPLEARVRRRLRRPFPAAAVREPSQHATDRAAQVHAGPLHRRPRRSQARVPPGRAGRPRRRRRPRDRPRQHRSSPRFGGVRPHIYMGRVRDRFDHYRNGW